MPLKVSVCELISNPARYNHALVEVSGHITHAFEVFVLSPDDCQISVDSVGIWLEYGGKKSSGTVYCCDATSKRTRQETLVVEGVRCDLDEDAPFQKFDQIIDSNDWTEARVSIVGRFFSGRQMHYPNGYHWGGYGHMGMYSLLVIEKVLSVAALQAMDVPPPPDHHEVRNGR